jgi:hypothetical protein
MTLWSSRRSSTQSGAPGSHQITISAIDAENG